MIIKYHGKNRLVYGLVFMDNGFIECFFTDPDEQEPNTIKGFEEFFATFTSEYIYHPTKQRIEIVDKRIPPVSWFFREVKGAILANYCLFPACFGEITGAFLDNLVREVLGVERTLIANEMLAFHGMPPIEIPPEYLPEPNEEINRQKAINDELEEYLRIAEEKEKK